MTIVGQYERALVEAAGRRRRRLPAWTASGARLALTAVAALAVAAVLAGAALVAGRGERPAPARHGSALAAPSLTTVLKSTALVRRPAVRPSGRTAHAIRLTPATFEASVDRLIAQTPYPPGRPDPGVRRVVHLPSTRGDMTGISTLQDAQAVIEFRAWCRWMGYWRDAHRHGAAGAQTGAARILADAARWPTIRDTATAQRASAVARAAQGGDVVTVARTATGSCRGL